MKRLLLIICLLPVMAFGQFSGAKKLLLQQQGCQYGNLVDYVYLWYFTQNVKCGITTYYCNTLSDTKNVIDVARSCSTTVTTQGYQLFLSSIQVGSYVLTPETVGGNIVPKCELFPTSFWGFDNAPDYPVGSTWIYHIENGVITYMERY